MHACHPSNSWKSKIDRMRSRTPQAKARPYLQNNQSKNGWKQITCIYIYVYIYIHIYIYIYITHMHTFYIWGDKTLKIYFLEFQMYDTVLLTTVTMLYIRSWEFLYPSFITETWYSLTIIFPLHPHPHLSSWKPPFYSILLWIWHFLSCTYEIMQYLSFWAWLMSLNILHIHPFLSKMSTFHFYGYIIFLCM
jgi:hypothetical protein